MPFEESPKAAEQAEDDTQVHAVHAENSSQVQLLKDLLLQQTRRSEQLGKQAAARDWERWELLQLLRQKDEQLEFEETAAAKQRVVLNGARAGARHYRAVCCLRAWRSHVQQLCAERALLRAKNKQAVARLRHAGSLLHMVLKHVLNRQLKSGMNQLWLHATAMLAVPEALAEKRKDESGFFTPRRNIGTLQRIASPSWDASPLMRVAASEVSTEIPSRDGGLRSSSSSGWQGASVDPVTRLFKPDAVAAARLVIHLQSMLAQRLFWSVGEWKRHRSKAQEASRLEEQQRLQNRFIWEQHAAEQAALQAEHSELLISLEAAESSQEELHRAAFAAEADAVAHAQPDDAAKIEEPSLEPAAETSENFEKPAAEESKEPEEREILLSPVLQEPREPLPGEVMEEPSLEPAAETSENFETLAVQEPSLEPAAETSENFEKPAAKDRGGEERPRRRSVAGPAAVCPTLGKSQEEPPSRINDKMLLCLQTCCSDAEPMCWQILQLICYIVIFGASLALVVLWAYVIFPFQKPEMGFWANWVFNFVAHPVANYIVARGVIGWFARQILWDLESRSSLCKTERSRIKQQIGKVLNLAPIADSLWCVSEHFLFSLASIYPIPFSVPLSCIPGAFLSMGVFYRLLSKEVRVLQSTAKFFRFTFCTLSGFCLLYAGMVFYTAFFGQVEMGMQLVMSFSVSAVEFLMGKVIQKLGNWWNVPIHIVRELATCMKLPVIIFKASILSEAKGLWVFLSMVLPEVLQVGCSVMMVLFDLLSSNTQIQEAFATVRSRQQFVQACCISYYEFKCVQQRLKHIVQSCKTTSKKDLERMAWTWRNDHDLLNEISSSLTATVMLEVCEVMAPVIYIGLLLCLRSNTFLANNASYFLGLANANFQESLIANSFSLLLEASLLLVTELCVRAVIGMSFCSFIGSVLRCDFRFWLSTLSMAYIAWLTMVVQHTGHDLKFQFSWLP